MRPLRVSVILLAITSAGVACKSNDANAPGALVEVSMTSTVGVLLDEVPASMRERVATELLAQNAPFWTERATRQVELTDYRLAFREFFYEEEKGQLRLPPSEVWEITLDTAGARRALLGSHDAVVIDYAFRSTVLSDRKSPGIVEPALAEIGGVWDEPFIFPVDPELVFQRTGYACIDEAEFPPSSVDAENVRTFYDQDCEVETQPSKDGCHWTELPTLSCVEALDAVVGKVETNMHYERVPYRHAEADRVRVGTITNAGGADLMPLAEDLTANRVVYRYVAPDDCGIVEGCVAGPGWRRLLRFDANVKNVGGRDMHVGEVDYFLQGDASALIDHNVYEFSACHEHYHFSHYSTFNLDTLGGSYTGNKGAFCLETSARLMNTEDTSMSSPYAGCDYQGLTAGWGDEYSASLECQWIDITDMNANAGDQTGRLTFVSNPDGFLCEGILERDSDGNILFEATSFTTAAGDPVDRPVCDYVENHDANNTAGADVFLPATGGMVTQPCGRGQIGPLRDCALPEIDDAQICAPGAPAFLTCAVTTSGGQPQVVRVCEASEVLDSGTACVFRDALANAVVTTSSSVLSFTCPDSRGVGEPGGRVAVYSGPVWPADPQSTVTCTP